MKTLITNASYKNTNALVMESRRLIVTVIPESGSKIQSIYDKQLNKEYLFQSSSETFTYSTYNASFAAGDTSGFDEIFPSIESCIYPADPWKGVIVPDHGEVWSLPWEHSIKDNAIWMSTHGVRFPYRLEKSIEFVREDCIRIKYRAINLSHFDFRFIWAPHILLECGEDTEIVLPPSVTKIYSTCSVDNRLGKFGEIHNWPVATIKGEEYEVSKVYPKYPGKCEKYYAYGKIEEGWCALHNQSSGDLIGLSYPIDKVPYLGVWEGIMDGKYVTALEPCTGDLDFLNIAMLTDRAATLKANSQYEWFLNICVGTAQRIGAINMDGIIE
jgi:hypothetical protein